MRRNAPVLFLWLPACLTTALLLGCDDAGGGSGGDTDAALSGGTGGTGGIATGGAGGERPDAGTPELPTGDRAATASTPVLLGDRLLVSGPDAVQDANGDLLGAALAANGRLLDAVVVAADATTGAAVFAVVDTGAAQQLVALDAEGHTAWTLDAGGGTLRRPALRNDRLLVVSSDAAGAWQARWVSRADGAVLATLPLGDAPATPPARLSSTDTDWVLGVGGALVALRATEPAGGPATLEETSRVDAEVAQVTSVQTTGCWLLSATGWQGEPAPAGLGDRLIFAGRSDAEPTGVSLFLSGHPVATPDVIEAAPVVVRALSACVGADCVRKAEGVVASGGSHWFGGWQSETGASLFLRTDLSERVTGLAVGGDDRVFSGGSHWLPGSPEGGHVLRAWQLGADAEVGVSATDAVLVDTAGMDTTLVVGASSALVRDAALTYAVTHADGAVAVLELPVEGATAAVCGWPRAYGDDANAGNHVMTDAVACE